MARLQQLPVHPKGQQRVGIVGFGQRQAARKLHGLRVIGLAASVRPLEQDFDGSRLHPCFLQHQPQWHAGPFGVTDRAGTPLHAMDLLLEKGAPIAGAFDRGEHRALG